MWEKKLFHQKQKEGKEIYNDYNGNNNSNDNDENNENRKWLQNNTNEKKTNKAIAVLQISVNLKIITPTVIIIITRVLMTERMIIRTSEVVTKIITVVVMTFKSNSMEEKEILTWSRN